MPVQDIIDWANPSLETRDFTQPYVHKCHAPTDKQHSGQTQSGSQCSLAALNSVRHAFSFFNFAKLDFQGMFSDETTKSIMNLSKDLGLNADIDMSEALELPIFRKTVDKVDSPKGVDSTKDLALITFLVKWKEVIARVFPALNEQIVIAAVIGGGLDYVGCLRLRVSETLSPIYVIFEPHPRMQSGPTYTICSDIDVVATHIYHAMRPWLSSATYKAQILEPKPGVQDLKEADLLSETISYLRKLGKTNLSGFIPSPGSSSADFLNLIRERADRHKGTPKKDEDTTDGTPESGVDTLRSRDALKPTNARRSEFGWQLSLLMNTSDIPALEIPSKSQESKTSTKGEDGTEEDTASSEIKESSKVLDTKADDKPGQSSENPEFAQNEFAWIKSLMAVPPLTYPVASIVVSEEPKEAAPPDPPLPEGSKLLKQSSSPSKEPKIGHMQSRSEFGWQLALQQNVSSSVSSRASSKKAGPHLIGDNRVDSDEDVIAPAFKRHHRKDDTMDVLQEGVEDAKLDKPVQSAQVVSEDIPASQSGSTSGPGWIFTASVFCGICNETFGQASSIKIKTCQHGFCKPCAKSFVESKLENRKYPIICPVCYVERGQVEKGQFTQETVDELGFTAQQLEALTQLQLNAHAILTHCPRCQESFNVDRGQFMKQNVLQCPLPGCGHKWCKACLKNIANSRDTHKCKGVGFDKLVRKKGWRYCPGCQTPVQKESGCNHMTCASPGCNVHFCYKCSQLIVDTSNGGDLGAAVTDHYANCKLFERRQCVIQ